MNRAASAAAVGLALTVLAAVSPTYADGRINSTAPYVENLNAAAKTLTDAAAGQHAGAAVPDVHVPPAPLPGPPRFSPSLDDWLQANLNAVRTQKNAKDRTRNLRTIAATLRQAANEVTGASQHTLQPAQPIALTLAAILAQSAYHQKESATEAQPHKSLLERFAEWLAGLLDRLFSGLFRAASGAPLIGRLLTILMIAVIALIIVLVAYRLARYVLSLRRRRASEDGGELIARRQDPAELYAQARSAAALGQYARAISLAFRASLFLLDANGFIDYDPARTAGEYRRAVRRARASAAPPFDELAQTFTLATYAELPVGEGDWNTADFAYGRLEPIVQRRT